MSVSYLAAYVDAGLATGVKDEEIVLEWKLLVFEDIVAGRKLFFGHRMVFVCGTPYAYRFVPCGGRYSGTFFHHRNARHIEHSYFAARDVFKGMPQAAVVTKGMIVVLPQFCCINRNLINGAAQFL